MFSLIIIVFSIGLVIGVRIGGDIERHDIEQATRYSHYTTVPFRFDGGEYRTLITIRSDGEVVYCADTNKKKSIDPVEIIR